MFFGENISAHAFLLGFSEGESLHDASAFQSLGRRLIRMRNSNSEGQMQYRILGHTGEKVSIVGLGGYHMGVPKDPG